MSGPTNSACRVRPFAEGSFLPAHSGGIGHSDSAKDHIAFAHGLPDGPDPLAVGRKAQGVTGTKRQGLATIGREAAFAADEEVEVGATFEP